jgi:hypothetical protein
MKLDMKQTNKEPMSWEAMEYVKSHTYMPISNEEFCLIETYFAEFHNKNYPGGIYGDADVRKYIYAHLEKTDMIILQNKVDAIANALFNYCSDTKELLQSIDMEFTFDTWYDWDNCLSDAIRIFKDTQDIYPTIMRLSAHTKSQIDYVTGISPKSEVYGDDIKMFQYSDIVDNNVECCTIKFQIDDTVLDKHFILWHTSDNDDDDDDDNNNDGNYSPININIDFHKIKKE